MTENNDRFPESERTVKVSAEEAAHSGISRRGFLKGAGLAVASTGLLDAAFANRNAAAGLIDVREVGPGAVSTTLHINGKEHVLQIEPRATLAEALRMQLGLTGTKIACDLGSCSACTVLVDKAPVNSCMMLAVDVVSRSVETIESLERHGVLHPVQAAFVRNDAMLCGFCTPGMVMTCVALIERDAEPSAQDVRRAISGNLCRCGAYSKVCKAALDAAATMAAATAKETNEKW